MKNMREKIITTVFCVILALGLIASMIVTDRDVSRSERRALKQLSAPRAEDLWEGSFMTGFDEYASDQFAARDALRSISSFVRLKLLMQKDVNGVYIEDGNIFKLEKSGEEDSPERLAAKIDRICSEYLQGMETYFAVIPEKSYYSSSRALPDYRAAAARAASALKNTEYIDIFPLLSLDDYYRTDLHWRQERIFPVVQELAANMGFEAETREAYTEESYSPFYGSYYSQLGLGGDADELIWLNSETLRSCEVSNIESGYSGVYDEKRLSGMDTYDVFLSGATALTTIEDPNSQEKKSLLLFRDSFGSSIAPLMASGYQRITLVDLRYMSPSLLPQYVDLAEYDQALFLYSTMMVDNSALLRS